MPDGAAGPLDGLLGRSAAMESLRQEIRQFGPSDLRIHVHGETGAGKEGVARALHALSPRARGPFVPFNAAGFTDELVEAELFGHTRGAFTGAVGARKGYVAEAEHGTLFLDEVAELTPRAQAKLLRFLEQNEYHRLGETIARRADVRLLSATNVDLGRLVGQRCFRRDLWYRLHEHCVHVPPLRERGGDVLLLARHFLKREAARLGRRPPRMGREAEAAIRGYPWPGNVRQLASEMRRVLVIAGDGVVGPEHLSAGVRASRETLAGGLRSRMLGVERRIVGEVLDRHGGNRTAAAAELGITRQALVAKLRRLGLSGTGPRSEDSASAGLERGGRSPAVGADVETAG
jgi:DNA-binding NtrC family response regulator